MADCIALSGGRKLACKGKGGGLKAVSFGVWKQTDPVLGTDGEVTALPTSLTALYRYQLKNTGNTYTEEIVSDSETRTVQYNGTLALVLQRLNVETRNEIKMLAMGETVIFLETNDDQIFVIGAENGADLTGGSFVTGGARGDMSGSNLTFTTSEDEPYLTLSTAAKALYAGITVDGV